MEAIIETLLEYAIEQHLMEPTDRIYARNRILACLKEEDYTPTDQRVSYHYVSELLQMLCDIAVKKGILEDTLRNRDAFDSQLMNCFMPRPSEMIHTFETKKNNSPVLATNYFYHTSIASNYIRKDRIDKNVSYKVNTEYGIMDITINLSKPEKDPRDIAKASKSVSTSYPSCVLCKECEGYYGSLRCDGRSNHRIIPLKLNGEDWFFQYSPYVYYNEHCIVLNGEHVPMKTCRETFIRLLEFVEQFPHYFLGSNADLPIVGGSILSHDHFQGGNYEFAMANAKVVQSFQLTEDVRADRLFWPLSVLRLSSVQKEALIDVADTILQVWRQYDDPAVEVYAKTDGQMHNTITSIARYRNNRYELDLVFRNNRTSKEHPMGIFHPHEEVHHIKKENIGLIEVMGLAVLPARLKTEMQAMKDYLLDGTCSDLLDSHLGWLQNLQQSMTWTKENVEEQLQEEVGKVFVEGLRHCGIYSFDEKGDIAFQKLIDTIEGTLT